jgi:hypothetical protein
MLDAFSGCETSTTSPPLTNPRHDPLGASQVGDEVDDVLLQRRDRVAALALLRQVLRELLEDLAVLVARPLRDLLRIERRLEHSPAVFVCLTAPIPSCAWAGA